MKDIQVREDVNHLVRTFYAKVREDKLLGPIFNKSIEDWESHFDRLTDFWETNLFFVRKFHGDPMQAHIEVDKKEDGTINELHFGVWLNLWFQTVDELFDGEVASIAKNRARNMSTFIHLKIFEARQNGTKK